MTSSRSAPGSRGTCSASRGLVPPPSDAPCAACVSFCRASPRFWVTLIYPWLSTNGLVDVVGRWLAAASAPFEPYIRWRVGPDQFPINSQELFFITMLISAGTYVAISLLTSRQRFNMDQMLHRGRYKLSEEPDPPRQALAWRVRRRVPSQANRGSKCKSWRPVPW